MTPPKKKAPAVKAAGSRTLDLDALRAARAEVAEAAPTVTFGGREFTLPAELPINFAVHTDNDRLGDAMGTLLGDQADAFFALEPSLGDIVALVGWVAEVYGVSPGESEASDRS